MDDDVDIALARLERRLDELQAQLADTRSAAPAPAPPPPAAAAADPLDQFGAELRRLAHDLVAAWERVHAHERRAAARARERRRIVLEADADLHALADLERALAASPHVADVALRAYAGGHASLTVEFEPPAGPQRDTPLS